MSIIIFQNPTLAIGTQQQYMATDIAINGK